MHICETSSYAQFLGFFPRSLLSKKGEILIDVTSLHISMIDATECRQRMYVQKKCYVTCLSMYPRVYRIWNHTFPSYLPHAAIYQVQCHSAVHSMGSYMDTDERKYTCACISKNLYFYSMLTNTHAQNYLTNPSFLSNDSSGTEQ